MRLSLIVLPILLAACAPFPEVDALGPDPGPPPQLLPIDEVLAQAGPPGTDPGPAVAARAAALKARAAGIGASP